MAAGSTVPSWPPTLSDQQLAQLSQAAVDYALSHSIVYRPLPQQTASSSSEITSTFPPHDASIHAPISLLPSPFPAALYEESQALQPLYNDLYARITVDQDFLERVIGGDVILADEFQAQLWQLWSTVRAEGVAQTLHLGLFRSDYLLHRATSAGDGEDFVLKQVELNTISSSFGPLCTRVSQLHRYLAQSASLHSISPALQVNRLPINRALETLASGLAAGHRAYLERTKSHDAVVLFVVQDGERNAFDQRLIEYELLEQHGIRVRRASLTQLAKSATLDTAHARRLLVVSATSDDAEEVSVVYFRAGYTPNDYPTQQEWDARLLLERSLAIKCPTAALQLAGAKKVQQVLAEQGVLESLLQDERRGRVWSPEDVQRLRESFMPMYGMEADGEGVAIASDAKRSKDYVLKPQREGGGNNVYRDDIVPTLQHLDQLDAQHGEQRGGDGSKRSIKRREAYILMKLIEPPQHVGNYLLRHGGPAATSAPPKAVLASHVISELGAFGTILFEANAKTPTATHVVFEQSGGHLLRTKASESNEGGVAAGYSVIDSPLLV